MYRRTFGGLDENWTLSSYRRRVCGSYVYLRTMYDSGGDGKQKSPSTGLCAMPGGSRESIGKCLQSHDRPLGLAAGGKM